MSLCSAAILEGWDTPIQDRGRIVAQLVKHATGETGAGDQTQVSAAKTLMDVSVKRAAMEQAERFKSKEASTAPEDGLEEQLRRALEAADD